MFNSYVKLPEGKPPLSSGIFQPAMFDYRYRVPSYPQELDLKDP